LIDSSFRNGAGCEKDRFLYTFSTQQGDRTMTMRTVAGLLTGGAMMIFGAVSGPAHASVVVQGTAPGYDQFATIQFWYRGGTLHIDGLARNWTGGPTGVGIEDTTFVLREDDGSPLTAFTGSVVEVNDDYFGTAVDGSTSVWDSYISTTLTAGNYLLGIGRWGYFFSDTPDTVASGSGITEYFGNVLAADFQVTFSDDVMVTAINGVDVNKVPLPAAVWFMLTAIGGLVGSRWLRTDKAAVAA
jgi:hypothetical protein